MSEPCRHERELAARPTDYLRGYRDGLNAILDAIKADPLLAPLIEVEATEVTPPSLWWTHAPGCCLDVHHRGACMLDRMLGNPNTKGRCQYCGLAASTVATAGLMPPHVGRGFSECGGTGKAPVALEATL